MTVTANGPLTLQGFPDSAVTALTLTVKNFDALVSLVRNSYGGRLVDVLVMKKGA